jgi:branched-chain amino acid transport system ATP-binding protein
MSELLQVQDIQKRFGALQAIELLRFSLNEGEILGIIGPNGAGKTTAINLISGMMRPDNGRVFFAEEDVTGMSPHVLVNRGLVRTFQATTVYQDQTVRENVLRGAYAKAYPGLLKSLWRGAQGLSPAEETFIDDLLAQLGLAEMAPLTARNLPYGHQKVLGLAIALAAQPRLMMLDEPAAGLAHDEVVHLEGVIRRANASGISMLVVDHNMRFISTLCQRVVVLHHGAELATGTPREVTRDHRVIEAYLGTPHEPA